MSSATFQKAIAAVLEREGGYVSDPHDNGGETNFGISKKAYPELDIAALSIDQAVEIYRRHYWDRVRGDELPAAIAWCVFDQAVNRGVSAAIRTLQQVLGVAMDGVIGPATLQAARTSDQYRVVARLQAEAVLAYARHEDWARFGRGWTRRAIETAMEAQTA